MREHQIIINLKPEHYQELERLSRVAGSRSVSIFVKERILASLGIGGGAAGANLAGNSNLSAVTADIRRLHRDLQVFVAESLSGRDFGYVASPDSERSAQSYVDDADSLAVPLGDNLIDPSELAPVDGSSITSGVQSESAEPDQKRDDSKSAETSSQSIFNSSTRAGKPGGTSIGPGASSFPVSNFYGQKGSQPNIHFPIQASPNASSTSASQPNSAKEANPTRDASVPDDLEELAERAFAISPRLGAIDEMDDDTPMFSDPLDELLGDLDDEENDQLGAESTSSADSAQDVSEERTNESSEDAPADEGQASIESVDTDAEDDSEESVTDSAQAKQVAAQAGSQSENQSNDSDVSSDSNDLNDFSDAGNPNTQAASSTAGKEVSEEQSQTRPSTSNQSSSQNPPPLSGGPPPRRRRT